MARLNDADHGFVAGPLLTGSEILRCLVELATILEARAAPPTTLVVVGGSYLALHGLRDSTRDVDSGTRLTDQLLGAAQIVANRHGLSAHWLNDNARPYLPADFDQSECSTLFEHSPLLVVGPHPDDILMMKAYAAREVDMRDAVVLWPMCSFSSPAAAVARFWSAYPHAPADDHLESHFAEIERRARAAQVE